MITWITGQTGAGKTTLAREIALLYYDDDDPNKDLFEDSEYFNCIWFDGDDMREIWTDLDFSREGRWEHNLRIARLAKMLNDRGHNIVISVICPYKELRQEIKELIDCKFIYIEGGNDDNEHPYEHPQLY